MNRKIDLPCERFDFSPDADVSQSWVDHIQVGDFIALLVPVNDAFENFHFEMSDVRLVDVFDFPVDDESFIFDIAKGH